MPHGIIDEPLNVIENVAGVIVYPLKPNAIGSYDATSVTATRSAAWTFTAIATVIHHITVLEGTVGNFLNIVNGKTGSVILPITIDPTAFTLPHTIRFGDAGLRLPYGFGIRALDAGTLVHVFYERIMPT